MCFIPRQKEYTQSGKHISVMKTQEIKRIIDQLPGLCLLTFTGGEPTIRKDFSDIIRYAARKNKCNIITNGTLLSDQDVAQLVELAVRTPLHAGLILIGISMEGPEDVHDNITGVTGSYQRTKETIERILYYRKNRKYPLVDVKTVISESNLDSFSHVLQFADKVSADFCTFQILSKSTTAYMIKEEQFFDFPEPIQNINLEILKKELNKVEELSGEAKTIVRFYPDVPFSEIVNHYSNKTDLANYSCHFPWYAVIISPYGDVFPCLNWQIGNLRQHSLKELWNSSNYVYFRRKLRERKIFPVCVGCCNLSFNPEVTDP